METAGNTVNEIVPSEVAPICPASRLNWIDNVAAIGSVTKRVGTKAVPAMNAACWTNSPTMKRPVAKSVKKYCAVRTPSTT